MVSVEREKRFLICADAGEVSRRGAGLFVELAHQGVACNGRFSVALSGGSTPKTMFTLLAGDDFRDRVPWQQVDFFWGDERCVPPDHRDSNYRMARETLLDNAPIPQENIYRVHSELEDIASAAMQYQETLKKYFDLRAGELPRFDLVYLGMGDDGHTASLFPGTKALMERQRLVTENYVDKLSAYRITLTAPALNKGRNLIFLITGEGKASRVKEVLEGPYEPDRLPSQLIRPTDGKLLFILDRAAASQLSARDEEL
ncbi:6-phosphogluconolactonase [Acidobacteria bacterium AH-259-D05]|nr:6-phosphogluconolactonase [Acidobacteria bacterium AH-259-D05]